MPTWVNPRVRGSRRRGALPGLRADYKVSFLPGECLRISNKAAILSPFATDNEAVPRRAAALAPSRFLFTHQRTGFAVYTVRSPLRLRRPPPWRFSPAVSKKPRAISGYANTPGP